MLLLQKTGFFLNITDWIRVLNQRICHHNPELNPADYSILENLSQRLSKHQRIRDMRHLKDILEELILEELPQYESDACINQFRYRLLKVIEVAGKQILNIFF